MKIRIAYSATAFIAVLVVLLYYILAYCPDEDPFRKSTPESPEYSPNPFDTCILSARLHRRHANTLTSLQPVVKHSRIRMALTEVNPR
jgi:hypothetical protein